VREGSKRGRERERERERECEFSAISFLLLKEGNIKSSRKSCLPGLSRSTILQWIEEKNEKKGEAAEEHNVETLT
jgi:hypothetical protein